MAVRERRVGGEQHSPVLVPTELHKQEREHQA